MKKLDMDTRQGRARRRSADGFNRSTLLPHSPGWVSWPRERRARRMADRARRWREILGTES